MWINKSLSGISHAPHSLQMPIEDLVQGEIFSLNTKSKRLVLSSIDPFKKPHGIIVTHELISNAHENRIGREYHLNYNNYKNRSVMVWGSLEDQTALTIPFEELDRVRLKNSKIEGTIVLLNKTRSLDDNATILWDEIIHGNWIVEQRFDEIEHLGVKATNEKLIMAQEAKSIVKDMQNDYGEQRAAQTKQMVADQVTKRAAAREEFRHQLVEQEDKQIAMLAQQVTEVYASELNNVVEAGILSVTAGENNYEIDLLSKMIDGYLESILFRVGHVVHDPVLQIPVTLRIAKTLGNLMLDRYFLTREGYIQQQDNRWMVYSKRGKLIGRYANKKKALSQLRNIERLKRRGI